MTDVRIEKFPIAQLEYVFVPPGLPLVTKSDAPATTSILIRGGAGTGKTTLAVALAHAISREQAGVTLYLTTEFVATELRYKAVALALPENSVDAWESTRTHVPGAILAEHLVRTRTGSSEDAIKTVANRKRAAIDAVWEILARGGEEPAAEREGDPPVRAVVIDGFGLPEVEQEDKELRHELLTLLQSLELIGITPIVVEESGVHSEAWLPFVVDIVFEIELWSDPDMGYLARRLKVPKSRYGQALPGPHDYGLSLGKPALWPDLGFAHSASRIRRSDLAPAIFLPAESSYMICEAGSILVSKYDETSSVVDMFVHTPGIAYAWVTCGPQTKIRLPKSRAVVIDENEGVFSLAWVLLEGYRKGLFNSVLIEGFGFFLSRIHAARALRMVTMLGAAGISVCLHDRGPELKMAFAIADFVHSDKVEGRLVRKEHDVQHCRAARWLEVFDPTLASDAVELHLLFNGTKSPEDFRNEIRIPLPPRRNDDAEETFYSVGNHGPILRANTRILFATVFHLTGSFARAAEYLEPNPEAAGLAFAQAAFRIAVGDGYVDAEQLIVWHESPGFRAIWAELSAIYAQNTLVIEVLAKKPVSELSVHQLMVLMQALARTGDARLSGLIDACGERFELANWYLERLRTEHHLDTQDPKAWAAASQALGILVEDGSMPAVHRAETFYNLGVARSRLRDEKGARDAYRRALELNPFLEIPIDDID